jgi:hypothetical protein
MELRCLVGMRSPKMERHSLRFDESTVKMLVMDTSSTAAGVARARKLRWDIRVGLFASALAIAGLISSIVRGNEDLIGENFVPTGLQKTMLVFALGMAVVTVAKWWHAKKHGKL